MSTEPLRRASLGIADLATVLNETFPCCAKWYNLGVQLQVDVGILDCFRIMYIDPRDQLREVLRTWLTTSDNPTWQAMVQALSSPVIKEVRLARELQKKYFSSGQPLVDVPLRREALEVRTQVRTLQDNFVNIATRTSGHIRKKNFDAQDFRVQFVMQMDISQRHENHQFIQCCLKKLEPGTTIDDLLFDLSMYWDFFNYGLLEHTINIFGDASLKQDMKDYADKLRAFRVNTKLCDFIDNWPVRGQDPPKANFKRVVSKMRKKWNKCTLEDIENFRETLTHKFFLPNFALLLREAKKGCVCLTWYTPAPIANTIATTIQESLPGIETEFFNTHGIQRVSVSGQECYTTPVKKSTTDLKGIASLSIESSLTEYEPLPPTLGEIEGIEQLPIPHVKPLYTSKFTGRTQEEDLMEAARRGSAGTVKELIQQGATVNFTDKVFGE